MMNQNIQEECFVNIQTDSQNSTSSVNKFSQCYHVQKHSLPIANQLHPQTRPTLCKSRIFVTEPFRNLLPACVDQSCFQISLKEYQNEGNVGKQREKCKLGNKERLGLSEYLKKAEFNQVYCKYGKEQERDEVDKTMRLRTISQLSDYNPKHFKQLQQQCQIINLRDKIDSNIECGNLCYAYTNINVVNGYYLLLEQDTNTHGYTNWFFYRFRNVGKGKRKFYIMNLGKNTLFYKQGMKISIFSMKGSQGQQGQGMKWKKGGIGINFFMTNFIKNEETNEYFYCLYFEYNFEYENDEVYFALSQPYTYTRLSNFIGSLDLLKCSKVRHTIETIGYTLSNNIIPAITLSSCEQVSVNKKTIVILGRQHPSQMAGSFICEYMIKILRQQNECYLDLLSKFNIVFIPMLNPDGVIYGNSRSNLAGYDLNRHWGGDAIKQLTPQTCKIRLFLSTLQKNSEIRFLLDIHGHGKKLNTFLFCCRKQDRISNRVFPLLMDRIQQRFDINLCTYGISRDKEKTIRAQLHEIGINDCYTLENSYYGYAKKGSGEIICYNQKDYRQIGMSILKSLGIYLGCRQQKNRQMSQDINVKNIEQQLERNIDKIQKIQKEFGNDDILSESDPEGDGLKLEERLKICNHNRILDNKIRESFKVNKPCQLKKYKKGRTQKAKTLPIQQSNESFEQKQRISTKIQKNRNLMNKKIKIENRMKINLKNRKISLHQMSKNNNENNNNKKIINKTFNLFQTPICSPRKFVNKNVIQKTQSYDRTKIYQKLNTQVSQTHKFSVQQIKQQNDRKQKIGQQYMKIKNESLKNMMKQSLLFLGNTFKNKKCKWVEDKKQRNRTSNHFLETKSGLFGNDIEDGFDLRWSYKSPIVEQKQKIYAKNIHQSSKGLSEPKTRITRKSFHRFQNFTKKMLQIKK